MLYYLFDWLETKNFPGAGVFQYISFRAAIAFVLSLIIAMVFGKSFINLLRKKQIGETVRDLGLAGQSEKAGTPTMGGLLIIAAILIPVLLLNRLDNIYIILMIFTTIWLGVLGFIDDYIKVFKHNKKGLTGKAKLIGQVVLGLVVAVVMYFHPDAVIQEDVHVKTTAITSDEILRANNGSSATVEMGKTPAIHSTKTTIPFVKNNEFDYQWLVGFMGDHAKSWVWLAVVLVFIFIITAVSNGANLTDGMDGLAAGTSAIICATLVILAYISGNIIYTRYLNFIYIPNCGELVIFMSALVGALIGFLWYNTNPAQIFMGDTGSLTLGGLIAVCAILIRKELLLPVLCGIFLAESASVLIQTSYFKYTKKKYGAGRRVFLMSPLHHHYQKKGFPEPKIVTRFWIVGIILAIITLATLKIR